MCCIFFLAVNTFAQKFISPFKPSLIGLHFTLIDYNSPTLIKNSSLQQVLKKGDIFNPSKQAPAFTISYWRGISRNIDLSGKFNVIFYNYEFLNNPSSIQSHNKFGAELEANVNIRPISDAHFFTPFITVGIGGGHYVNKFGGYIPLGLDFQFNLKNKVYIFLQNQFRYSFSPDIFPDNLLHSIGIAIKILRKKPIVAMPVRIVQISDRDHDGVVDNEDLCPDDAGLISLNGCPDKDGDGISDKNDSCPGVAGVARYHGCPIPDTDNDGINDEMDKCPYVFGMPRYEGCPIPDTDHDGLNDEEDNCPNQAGPISNRGCPEIKPDIIQKINLAAKNIFFVTGSAELLPKSYPSLDSVAKILIENHSYKITVEGHTDISGTAANNQLLSEHRAASVKEYLINKGIDKNRVESEGLGAEKPVADNKTAAGRAENRRVELRLMSD